MQGVADASFFTTYHTYTQHPAWTTVQLARISLGRYQRLT